MSQVTLAGNEIQVAGQFPQAGTQVANFSAVNAKLETVNLTDFNGQRKILNIFPSIDTGICATSVRVFNEKASSLNNTVVLCISADLPFAQARFCGAEGLDNVHTLSTFRNKEIHQQLGVDIQTSVLAGLTSRAVIVLDENNQVLHSELVAEIKTEPNYDAALAVLG